MVSAAVALREDNPVAKPAALLSRTEVLARYRHLREISKRHHSAALEFLSKDAAMSQARRLGLTQGKTLVLDSMDDLNLAFDLAIHTAPKDRSRAIDRYARMAQLSPESDEGRVLDAMRNARFSIIGILRRHDVAGLIVEDLFRGVEVWLVDEGLESSLPDGAALATRLCTPEGFAMTAGVLVPVAAGVAWTISEPAKFLSGPTDGTNLVRRRKDMLDGLADLRHRRIVTAARKQMRDSEQRNGRRKPGLLAAEIPSRPYQCRKVRVVHDCAVERDVEKACIFCGGKPFALVAVGFRSAPGASAGDRDQDRPEPESDRWQDWSSHSPHANHNRGRPHPNDHSGSEDPRRSSRLIIRARGRTLRPIVIVKREPASIGEPPAQAAVADGAAVYR